MIILPFEALAILMKACPLCVAMIFLKKPELGTVDFLIPECWTTNTHCHDFKFQLWCILIGSHGCVFSSLIPDWDVELCSHFRFMGKATILAPCTGTYSATFPGGQVSTRTIQSCFLCQTIYIRCIISEKTEKHGE